MKEICQFILLTAAFAIIYSETRMPTTTEKDKLKKVANETHPKVKEFKMTSHLRPTKCQVCRVMVQELSSDLNGTENSKTKFIKSNGLDGKKRAEISYKNSELRLMEALERVCGHVESYRAIAGPEFPYIKNVHSMYRQELENLMKASGLALKFNAPQHAVDDPTFEIKRLHYECNQMVEEYEEEILEWFHRREETSPLESICKNHVLNNKNDDCLNASTEIPDWGVKTDAQKKGEKPPYGFLKHQRTEL